MMLSISHRTQSNLYDYVDQKIVPELEKITSVASVEATGGSSEYIKVELISEKMAQYKVTMSQITSAIEAANLSSPSGDTVVGNLELSVTTSLETEEMEDLKTVPITTSSGEIIMLQDVANITEAKEEQEEYPDMTDRKQSPFPSLKPEQHGHGGFQRRKRDHRNSDGR